MLRDCVWVCVNVGGVVDVVECGLFFESRCVWVDCQFVLLLFAFRDLWKEWGDSFFSTELPVPPQAAGVVGTFNVLDIYPSEHYDLSFLDLTDAFFLYTFPFCKYTLHVCYVFNVNLTDSFDDRRSQCRLIE